MDYRIDVKNKRLGRVATEIAMILQGKKNADYNPRFNGTDRAIVKNVEHITLSGDKENSKVYYKHTGPLGHLKESKYKDVKEKDPKWALRHAVNSMLPKNKLRAKRMRRLIFE
jgi:large subunit ribosomal protein L13